VFAISVPGDRPLPQGFALSRAAIAAARLIG
jgi:hypothetical protein